MELEPFLRKERVGGSNPSIGFFIFAFMSLFRFCSGTAPAGMVSLARVIRFTQSARERFHKASPPL